MDKIPEATIEVVPLVREIYMQYMRTGKLLNSVEAFVVTVLLVSKPYGYEWFDLFTELQSPYVFYISLSTFLAICFHVNHECKFL